MTEWKCIANLGGEYPLQEGGAFVLVDPQGKELPLLEVYDPATRKAKVYPLLRYELHSFPDGAHFVPYGYLGQRPSIQEDAAHIAAWEWCLPGICQQMQLTLPHFKFWMTSSDPIQRAMGWLKLVENIYTVRTVAYFALTDKQAATRYLPWVEALKGDIITSHGQMAGWWGRGRDANPYQPETTEFAAWDAGWMAAEYGAWVVVAERTNDPKLAWLERQLGTNGIPHRRRGHSTHAPILETPYDFRLRAWALVEQVDEIADDDLMFEEEC